jgi:phosphonate transport system substrate-binding protein
MEEQLGIPVKLFLGTDYTASIEAMRNGFVHVGYYGPFAFVLAHDRAKAEPFCVVLRDVASGVATYQSLFLALEGSGIDSLEDLKGKNIGWVDPTSTSGHLFPKAYLIEKMGLTYETVDDYFSNVIFTGGHEPSFLSVLNGDLDCAPITSNNYQRYLNAFKDHPDIGKIKVIDKTEPIPTSPFTYHADLPESLKEAVKEAFLSVEETPDGDGSIFIPVENSAYDVIRKTVTALGMDPEDLM